MREKLHEDKRKNIHGTKSIGKQRSQILAPIKQDNMQKNDARRRGGMREKQKKIHHHPSTFEKAHKIIIPSVCPVKCVRKTFALSTTALICKTVELYRRKLGRRKKKMSKIFSVFSNCFLVSEG